MKITALGPRLSARWRRWKRRRLIRELVRMIRRARQTPARAASEGRKARRHLEALGGFWHRAREVLALRLDVFSPEFCHALEGPAGSDGARPLEDVRTLFTGALSGLLARRLEDFDEQPVRSSPFGQIHTATVARTGSPVWVVLRRPGAERQLDEEVQEMEYLFGRLSRARGLQYVPWERLMRELRASLRDGLDFRIQAHALRELRKQVRRYAGAHYPHVYQQLSDAEVLVAERVEGPSVAEVMARGEELGGAVAWFDQHQTEPELLASRLWRSFMRQLVEARTLVPAQSAGDILLLGQGEFCYRFEPFMLPLEVGVPRAEAFHFMLRSLLRRSYEGAFFPVLKLTEPLPPLEPNQLKKVVSREIRAWAQRAEVETLPSGTRSFGALFGLIMATMQRHPIVFDPAVLRACQEMRRLEGVLFELHPEFRVASELRRFFKRSVRRAARRLNAMSAKPPAPDWKAVAQVPFTVMETAQGSVEQMSRGALPFATESTPAAYLVSRVAEFLSFVSLTVMVVLGVVAARLGSLIQLSPDSWVERRLVGQARHEPLDLGLAMIIALLAAWGLRRLAARFAQRDSHLPTRGVI